MDFQSHKNLAVWQKAMDFVTRINGLTSEFPRDEIYGLTSQMRRAAVSIPSNIAEGRSKRSTREFIRFVNISYGSAAELETQLMISRNLRYITDIQVENYLNELDEIARMLNGLHTSLEKRLLADP